MRKNTFRKSSKSKQMDDYNLNVLSDAKNEYSSRLLNILSPLVVEGVKSIFNGCDIMCR